MTLIDLPPPTGHAPRVPTIKPNRPYLAAWMRRFTRELSGSGALSQIAVRLSQDLGGTADSWKSRLSDILSGKEQPTLDLVTHIETLWAKHKPAAPSPESQGTLF